MKQNLVIKPRDTDWILGSSSPIQFKAVCNDWGSHLEFFERQKLDNGQDTNDCVIFTAQESLDAQMDVLIPNLDPTFISWLNANGYMDIGTDGAVHFHSSPRFVGINTGNKDNGNSLPEAWDAMRKFGVLPWKDLPADLTLTVGQYYDPAAITPAMYAKAAQFLALIGGKGNIAYHFVCAGTENIQAMKNALPQAPLCIGIAVDGNSWNQVAPGIASGAPVHSVFLYAFDKNDALILDHYVPYEKRLVAGYPIPYALQGVITPVYTPPVVPVPIPAQIAPTPQNIQILQSLVSLYQKILSLIHSMKGIFGSK